MIIYNQLIFPNQIHTLHRIILRFHKMDIVSNNVLFNTTKFRNIYTMENYKYILLSCCTIAMILFGSIIGIIYSERYVKVYIIYNVIMLMLLIHAFIKIPLLHSTIYGTSALLTISHVSILELIYKFISKQLWHDIRNFNNIYLNDVLIKLILDNDTATTSTIPQSNTSCISLDKIEEYKKDPRLLLTTTSFTCRATSSSSFVTIPSADSFDLPDNLDD
jgi:hypothetical protein